MTTLNVKEINSLHEKQSQRKNNANTEGRVGDHGPIDKNTAKDDVMSFSCSNQGCTESEKFVVENLERSSVTPSPDQIVDPSLATGHRSTRNRSSPFSSDNKNLCIMTVVHFVLTYPCTSIVLFVSFAMMTFPLPTYEEQAGAPFRYLKHVAQIESDLYYGCVMNSFQRKNESNDQKIRIENDRVVAIRQSNQRKLERLEDLSSSCYNTSIAMQRALQTWYGLSDQPVPLKLINLVANDTYSNRTNVCSYKDKSRLETMLHEELDDVQNNVMTLVGDFVSQSMDVLETIVTFSKERAEYDYNYFIGSKFEPSLSLIKSWTPPSMTLSLPDKLFEIELETILHDLKEFLKASNVQIDLLNTRIMEFKLSIDSFHGNYTDLYNRFASITIFVRDFLPESVKLPSVFDISGLPTADILLPAIFDIPTFHAKLPETDKLISDTIENILELTTGAFLEAAKVASQRSQQALDNLLGNLMRLLALEDYNPPKYPVTEVNPEIQSADDAISFLSKLADTTRARTKDAIKAGNTYKDEVALQDISVPDLELNVSDNLDDEFDMNRFSWIDTTWPQLSIPAWIVATFTWLVHNAILIEFITQFIRLWCIKRKYEKNAKPKFLEIDYVTNDHEQTDIDSTLSKVTRTIQLTGITVLKKLMSPWAVLGLMFLPVILFVFIFWFPHVKETCIDTRQGTALARKILAPTLINKANIRGNALYASSVMSCQQQLRTVCLQKQSETLSLYQTDLAENLLHLQRFNYSIDALDFFDRCIDTERLDGKFSTHCCGLEGYATEFGTECSVDQKEGLCPINLNESPPCSFRPIGESMKMINSSGCRNWNQFLGELEDSTFDCKVLQDACKNAFCSGVESSLILHLTIDADCSAEIYIIQIVVFVTYAIIHAIVINIVNRLLFNGIKSMYWRKIMGADATGNIKLLTYVNEKGEIIKGTDVHERSARVSKAIQQYERFGRIQFGMSAFFFIIWILSFFILKQVAAIFDINH